MPQDVCEEFQIDSTPVSISGPGVPQHMRASIGDATTGEGQSYNTPHMVRLEAFADGGSMSHEQGSGFGWRPPLLEVDSYRPCHSKRHWQQTFALLLGFAKPQRHCFPVQVVDL
jgi:hypothetical protein